MVTRGEEGTPDRPGKEEYLFGQIAKIMNQEVPSDEHIQELIRKEGNQWVPENIVISNRIPFHNNQVYVLDVPSIKLHILRLYHDSPFTRHLGQAGTYELIKHSYWWENMTTYIRNYVKGCVTCAQNKHTTKASPGVLLPLPIPLGPWEWTQSDHITGLPWSQGHDAIYVVMD